MNLAKMGSKYLFVKQNLFPLLSTVVLSSFAMLSFTVLYFLIKNTSCSKQKDKTSPTRQNTNPRVQQQSTTRAVLECWWLEARHGLRRGPQMPCVSSHVLLNFHLALCVLDKFCFLCWYGLWDSEQNQVSGYMVSLLTNLTLFFLLFWCHLNAGMVINHREMCY